MSAHLEEAHGLDVVTLVEREAVVDARREHEQVSRAELDPDPLVVRVRPHVEVALTVEDVPDLLVLVQVLPAKARQKRVSRSASARFSALRRRFGRGARALT